MIVSYPPLATSSDLTLYGMMGTGFGKLTASQISACLQAASDEVYSALSGRFAPPYEDWDTATVIAVCKIAAWELLNLRGYNPAAGPDKNIADRATQAREWINGVKNKAIHPRIVAAAAQTTYDQPIVTTSSVLGVGSAATGRTRGW